MQKQAELDVTIFARYIVPVLKIKRRYVGTEVYCKTTHAYNNAMKAILPGYGVTVIEIERKSVGTSGGDTPNYISASKVRQAIKEDRLQEVLDFLPDSTREFLLSEASAPVRAKIKAGKGRH
jgi:[citrate (pro-3S)-lyase] ligase